MTERRASQLSDAAGEWLLSALGNERLLAAVMALPALQDAVFKGGFQPVPATLDKPAVRRRLRVALLGRCERAEALLREAQDVPWSAAVEMVRALDESWLKRHWRGLVRGTGNPGWAVALLLDSRPALSRRGQRLLGRSCLWRADWAARPAGLPAALRTVARAGGDETAVQAPPREAVRGPATGDHEALRAALSRQRDKVREGQQELRQAQQASEQREKELRREVREAYARADRATAAADERIAEAIRAFKHDALGLTPDLLRLADAMADPTLDALLEHAERVLEQQRRLNEVHGTYESVRARIRALGTTAQRLSLCLEESIHVLPEVRRLHATVCREADRLRKLLPEIEAPVTELAAQLLGRIKEAAQAGEVLAELDRIEQLLQSETVSGLLGTDGVRHVRDVLSQRRRLVTDAVHGPALPGPRAPAVPAPRELWDVRTALAEESAAAIWVFVDGYNAIRRVPDLAAVECNEGLARSREVFCQLCRNRARAFAHMEVVFDGQGALSAREENNGVTVVFSKGLRESQNADDYLVTRLARARAEGVAVWLVSDDGGLRARAEASCTAFVACADWARFLRQPGN